MASSQEIQQLITNHSRRLQKLREQQAMKGISSEPDGRWQYIPSAGWMADGSTKAVLKHILDGLWQLSLKP